MKKNEVLMEIAAEMDALSASVKKLMELETQVPEEKTEVKAEPKTEEKKYTKADVRKALAQKSNEGQAAEVRALLQKHGASRLSDIPESEYEAIMTEIGGM